MLFFGQLRAAREIGGVFHSGGYRWYWSQWVNKGAGYELEVLCKFIFNGDRDTSVKDPMIHVILKMACVARVPLGRAFPHSACT